MNYNCDLCGRDIRIAGGSRERAPEGISTRCDRCLGRGHIMRDCDLCGFHVATTVARIVEWGALQQDLFPPNTVSSELYEVCTVCKENLRDRGFFEVITRHKCDHCNVRFGVLHAVFRIGPDNSIRKRLCPRCLPIVKEQLELTARQMAERYNASAGTVSDVVWNGIIEFKDNDCFIWNPVNMTIRRNHGTVNSSMEVRIQGITNDTGYMNGRQPNRVFIHDRDTVFILYEVDFQGARDAYAGIFGSMNDSRPPVFELHFTYQRLEIRSVEAERSRQQTNALQNAIDRGSNVFIREPINLMNNRVTTVNEDGDRIQDFRRITGVNFSHPYNDPEGRIFCWCSCGWMKQIPPTQHTLTHAGNTVVLQSCLYSPGGSTTSHFPNHIITMLSPETRDELQ